MKKLFSDPMHGPAFSSTSTHKRPTDALNEANRAYQLDPKNSGVVDVSAGAESLSVYRR